MPVCSQSNRYDGFREEVSEISQYYKGNRWKQKTVMESDSARIRDKSKEFSLSFDLEDSLWPTHVPSHRDGVFVKIAMPRVQMLVFCSLSWNLLVLSNTNWLKQKQTKTKDMKP